MSEQILIAQRHSEEDDIAFITYVSEYLRDPRYIRVNGKPLLLVYRPSILPDARKTADRWRLWCRANGIGEIFLACVFGGSNLFWLDAAGISNLTTGYDITYQIRLRPELSAPYDWRVFLERSGPIPNGLPLVQTVWSWDNEAEARSRDGFFARLATLEWLECMCRHGGSPRTPRSGWCSSAWNNGLRGIPEPDRRYGYAWLEATREALLWSSDR
jgi:hypothetical protein